MSSAIQTLIDKHVEEAAILRARQAELDAELNTLNARLFEIDIIVDALSNTTRRAAGSPPAAAPAAPAAAALAPAGMPKRRGRPPGSGRKAAGAPPVKRGRKPGPVAALAPAATAVVEANDADSPRKGRRKAVVENLSSANLNDMNIVEAAFRLAQDRNQNTADAGQILDWFNEAGYTSRSNNPPNRNSIYVSLNRAFTEGQKGNAPFRISRPKRGLFHFHFDN